MNFFFQYLFTKCENKSSWKRFHLPLKKRFEFTSFFSKIYLKSMDGYGWVIKRNFYSKLSLFIYNHYYKQPLRKILFLWYWAFYFVNTGRKNVNFLLFSKFERKVELIYNDYEQSIYINNIYKNFKKILMNYVNNVH